MKALNTVTVYLCRCIAGDGEGATKLLECNVSGAKDIANAKTVAKSVICSSLLKAAMFGADANWGRVLCAIGYSGAELDVSKIALDFRSRAGVLPVCRGGAGIEFSEEKAKVILAEDEIFIDINKSLRTLGFRGHKGAYELRKICIDHVYQKYGAEMAVSLSGDDIKTITKYYADPAQPNIGAVRVLDLI
jgi:hypothetical protein